MKQTEKVSIGGYSFTIENDAYAKLEKYLEDIRHTYSDDKYAEEIVTAIEERIAELLQERAGKDGITDSAAVDAVIGRIGSPSDLADATGQEAKGQPGPGGQDKTVSDFRQKRLYRNIDQRIAGGVCSGIAAYFNVDVVLIRLAFILLAFIISAITLTGDSNLFATGVVAALILMGFYVLLWIIIPAAKTVEQKCRMHRKPIDLEQFQKKFENSAQNFATGVKDMAKEVSTAPALHTAGRIISCIIGAFFMIIGISGLLSCTLYDLIPGAISDGIGMHRLTPHTSEDVLFLQALINPVIWWMAIGAVALFSIWILYNGVLLIFGMKAPRWKPGTILFILWIISLLVMAVYIIRRLIIIGSLAL